MRIHSDILTRKDIYAALPGNVQANCEPGDIELLEAAGVPEVPA